MSDFAGAQTQKEVAALAGAARQASRKLANLSAATRTSALLAIADAIEANHQSLLAANALDCTAAEPLVASGKMPAALFARLRIKNNGIREMAQRVREVAKLPDPLGRRLSATELDDGLVLEKVSCPLGVVAVVFEARPDVVPQLASLALFSGNALLLKGGAEAARSNEALVNLWKETLRAFPEIPADSVTLLQSRQDVMALLELEGKVDLLIPRGSKEFVSYIERNARIPVLGHGEGICHIYVDREADVNKAVAITVDSKTQYPAACNSAETLLVHRDVAAGFVPAAVSALRKAGVEVRGDDAVRQIVAGEMVSPASEDDWSTEYSDLILAIKIVDDFDSALEHIHRYGSKHTEAIVTENAATAEQFLREVDAAGVFHNASTRFADGYRYGLGAEVGISNAKLHARGPMGLEGLTTYKYKLRGSGQTVAEYSSGARAFRHKPVS